MGEKGDCPPPHLKYKLTKVFLMQSGAQIVTKHVHISTVYLQFPMLSLCVCATQWHTNT